jgi:predicted ribonuclease YlaK
MSETLSIIDTNVFIDHPEVLEDYPNVILSIVVLKELDELKYKDNIGYSARSAIRSIRKFVSLAEKDSFQFDTNCDNSMTHDMNIIMCAKRYNATLITKDVSMTLLAESFSVKVEMLVDKPITEYTPYIEDKDCDFPFSSYNLEGEALVDFKSYIRNKFDKEILDWTYYLTDKDIFCYNPKKDMLECISASKEYCCITPDEGVTFKPKDRHQKAAVYSILNADATLLVGGWGVGKSIVSTACALACAEGKKVFILRPTIVSKRYDVGFLPGDKKEKLYQYFSGFLSALASLYGDTRTQVSGDKDGKKVSYDYVKEDLCHEKFEFLTMPELHGLSIQNGDIIMVDEVQLLDVEYMSLLISRIGDGAKLILMGDMNQTVNLIKNSESGMNKLLNNLPHESISVVQLTEVYRNKKLCELADKLMK